ncbi:MAG: tetratricopeptide repeat protein [Sphingobacteriales bacterium JAD_PAG50586_3]|nr:MAG: tetratricopeptide repeat protein [Sphingobacteriales bacterium JAD_PAG50586_3]
MLLFAAVGMAQPGADAATATDTIVPLPGGKVEELAAHYYLNGEYDKAADQYEKLFDKTPNRYYYNFLLNCYLQLKDFKKGEKLVNKQIKRYPTEPGYTVDLGFIYDKGGDADKAKKYWENLIKSTKTTNQNYYVDLANAFINREQVPFALTALKQGRDNLKGFYGFNIELASIYKAQNNPGDMFKEYLDYLKENPEKRPEVQTEMLDVIADDATGDKGKQLKGLLLAEITKQPDKIVYPELLIWLHMQLKEFDAAIVQAKALDRRFKEDGFRLMELGDVCATNDNYDAAARAYQYVVDKGTSGPNYVQARLNMLDVQYKKITNTYSYTPADLTQLETNYKQTLNELGRNNGTLDLMLNLAHLQAFYLNKTDTAAALLQDALKIQTFRDKTTAQCKLELGDIMLLQGDIWEASLLYSQVEKAYKNEPIGQEAKFRNSRLYYYKGDFQWAKAQLDVLKAATAKFISNDAMDLSLFISSNIGSDSLTTPLEMFSRADLLYFQNRFDESQKVLDSIAFVFPDNDLADDIIYRKANIAYRTGNFTKAADFYNEVVTKYAEELLGDDSLFKLASIYQFNLGDNIKAMDAYQKLMTDFPGSVYVVEARKRFRTLRGDKVN